MGYEKQNLEKAQTLIRTSLFVAWEVSHAAKSKIVELVIDVKNFSAGLGHLIVLMQISYILDAL